MKRILLLGLLGMAALCLPACESEREVTSTTTTEETVTRPAATTTQTTRTVAY